ncbi:MAG TPA: hypothetical protein PK191_08275 [Niabella sp.]|nr:hypothetical protein [Niabella sp.]HOZ98058.1 hypothetical protein [Niabella sp.]HQW14797.1 hypothetical protein [Niabella sp.]HQX18578.1 hypothetical protein [Niabella sp.]HQX40798.1 hypothetical protein [Niabella sp.]
MSYHYLAFGIPFISEIELPALLPAPTDFPKDNPVLVKLGKVPDDLNAAGVYADHWAYCNENEMLYTVPGKIKFYISEGNQIVIEPISENYRMNLIYFYSNCLAAILYQRDTIPFHVSGVFVEENKVALFAAPSQTGKSTLALKLQELGFSPFTDDTAILFFENEKCYAQASYPMMRLWQNSLNQQRLLGEEDKQVLYEEEEFDKFGFSFHEQFRHEPVEVKQIVFMEATGHVMQTKPIKSVDAFKILADNVYRCHWIPTLHKNKLQFELISHVLKEVPFVLAIRPAEINSFGEFPQFIKNILEKQAI